MKKAFSVLLILALVLSVGVSLVGCGGGSFSDPTMQFTIAVVDEENSKVVGAKISILEGSRTLATVETDEKGVAAATLYPGEYTLRIDSLPDGYEIIEKESTVTFSKKNYHVRLPVSNKNLLGNEKNPHVIDGETVITLGLSKSAHYKFTPTDKSTLLIENAATLIAVVNGEKHVPDKLGRIIIDFTGEAVVRITNNGPIVTATARPCYQFGSEKNPYELLVNNSFKAQITDRTLYYSYTANVDGKITVLEEKTGGSYTLINVTASTRSDTEGDKEVSVNVNVGDVIVAIVTGTGEIQYRFELTPHDKTID